MTESNTGADALAGGNKSNITIVYVLYLASLLVGITAIIGVVMAYVAKGDAPDWLKSHYSFLIRTFWIGLLYGVIGCVLLIVIIGWLILVFTLVWWIVRCVQGLNYLGKNQPVPNYQSWLFA